MKARVKRTGEIVEVSTTRVYYTTKTPNRREHYECTELEILEDPDYWTRLEHQYAGMAMQGLLANHYITDRIDVSVLITETASAIANALVEKYKKEEK